ncbi:TPR repeat-containing protein [Gluconacetobacter diazotrophicus PA1 5]|nr:TPR repeat-containing protein [Gluconacetobacter diazotrophicus PA1 5]
MHPYRTPRRGPLTAVRLRFPAILVTAFLVTACTGASTSAVPDKSNDDLKFADVELESGAPQAALSIMQKRLQTHPHEPDTLVRLGRANAALGRTEPAVLFFREVLATDPDSVEAGKGLARVQLAADPREALATLRSLAARHPEDAQVQTDLGVAYDLCLQHAQAQAAYRQAMRLNPFAIAPQVNLGFSLAMSGRPNEAVQILGPLATSADGTVRIRQDFAFAEVQAGHEDIARRMLARDLPKDRIGPMLEVFRDFNRIP